MVFYSLPSSFPSPIPTPCPMMIVSLEQALLIHRLCDWDQRRQLEKSLGWSHVSHPCWIKNPQLLDCIPNIEEKRIEHVALDLPLHRNGSSAGACRVILPLPHGKYYLLTVDYSDHWLSTGERGTWLPSSHFNTIEVHLDYRVFYIPDGPNPQSRNLLHIVVKGKGWESNEIIHIAFLIVALYDSDRVQVRQYHEAGSRARFLSI